MLDFLCRFVFAANEKLLENCLQFITGSTHVPPMGFPVKISLIFTEEKRLPFARTCTLELQLSTVYDNYEDFEKDFKTAVYEHGGFQCV